MVVIGLVGTWFNGLALDYFMASVNRRKRICIIAKGHEEDIRKYITQELQRGCTLYDVRGGYNNNPHVEIQSLLAKDEFASLMDYIRKNDIQAFITAGNVSEVYGAWNKKRRKKVVK